MCPALGDVVSPGAGHTVFLGVELPMLGGCVAWHGAFSAGAGVVRCF